MMRPSPSTRSASVFRPARLFRQTVMLHGCRQTIERTGLSDWNVGDCSRRYFTAVGCRSSAGTRCASAAVSAYLFVLMAPETAWGSSSGLNTASVEMPPAVVPAVDAIRPETQTDAREARRLDVLEDLRVEPVVVVARQHDVIRPEIRYVVEPHDVSVRGSVRCLGNGFDPRAAGPVLEPERLVPEAHGVSNERQEVVL